MKTLSFVWFLNLLPCFVMVRSSSADCCRLLHRVAEHYNRSLHRAAISGISYLLHTDSCC